MGTSIVLNDVVFSNKNLPVIAELVSDGLVAAFRPTISKDSLVDLSGNGVRTTMIGNPVFNEGSISGYYQNGFRIEAAETESTTLMCVARTGYNATRNSAITAPLSSRWVQSPNNGNKSRGIIFDFATVLNGSVTEVRPYVVAQLLGTDGNIITKGFNVPTAVHKTPTATDETKSEYMFCAIRVDALTNTIRIIIPKFGINQSFTWSDATIKGRPVVNANNGEMSRFEVLSATDDSAITGNCDVSEVLIYNKALTEAQIYEQYLLSKSFFEKNRAISI